MKQKPITGFRNVDLDVVSSQSLDVLAEEVGTSLLVLHHGKGGRKRHRQHILVFEGLEWPNTPDSAINELCKAIERLSPAARKVWNRAKRKEFNVGYQLQTGMQRVEVAIAPKTLRRIVALGATVAFTCYRGEGNELRQKPDKPRAS